MKGLQQQTNSHLRIKQVMEINMVQVPQQANIIWIPQETTVGR